MELSGKPNYQPWNEDAFSGDIMVQSMTYIQKWMYRTLLQKAFFEKYRPDLPADENLLWRMAGCESRNQWDQNKEAVLEMFESDGDILFQKRLRQDWERLTEKRENMSNAGKAGATRRWDSGIPQKEQPWRKRIPEACRKILGVRPEREEYYLKDLKELVLTYSSNQVIEAFETWAGTQTTTLKYPIKDFIRVADGYLTNKVKPEDPGLEALCVSLYHIGGQVFAGKHKQLLNNLMSEFSFSEIEKAYKAFTLTRDEYDAKFAPRDFSEGGCRTIILATKQKQEKELKTQELIQSQTELARQEVEIQIKNEEEIEEHL